MAVELDNLTFEQSNDQLLFCIVLEEVNVKPVIFGIVLEESVYNLNCTLTDKYGNSISGATINISNSGNTSGNTYTSDENGLFEAILQKNIITTINISKQGYQNYNHIFTLDNNDFNSRRITMYKINSIIITSSGNAVNANPTNPENKVFI